MTEQITAGTEPWHDGQVLDVLAVMDALTMAVAAQTLFAAEVDKPTFIERQQCARDVLTGMARRVVIPVELLDKIPTRGNHRFDQARNCLRHHTGQPITNYRRAGIDHRNLLSMLLAARDDNGQGLADSEIHAFRMRLRQRRRDPGPGARGSGLGTCVSGCRLTGRADVAGHGRTHDLPTVGAVDLGNLRGDDVGGLAFQLRGIGNSSAYRPELHSRPGHHPDGCLRWSNTCEKCGTDGHSS
jgi:hypothetical protein